MSLKRGFGAAALIGALTLVAGASPAPAAVTVGQTGTPDVFCSEFDRVQPSVTSGNSYVVPSTGGVTNWTITSWSAQGGTSPEQMAMKFYRSLGGVAYQIVGHDGPRTVAANTLNTFQTSIAVKAGDILGNYTATTVTPVCTFAVTGESYFRRAGNLADGNAGDFTLFSGGRRLNISAQVEPTNTFTVGAITRNKKKGTATATITTQNPGTATTSGNGVRASSAGAHSSAITVPGAETAVQVPIRATGKKKKKLRSTGKVNLSPTISFTPIGGTASTQTVKVKLKKKL